MFDPLRDDERGAISYTDVILTLGTLVMIAAVAPLLFTVFDLLDGTADALTVALSNLALPLLIIGLIISMGVAASS